MEEGLHSHRDWNYCYSLIGLAKYKKVNKKIYNNIEMKLDYCNILNQLSTFFNKKYIERFSFDST